MKVELLSCTPQGDKLIAAAAKLCYSASDIDTLMENLTPEKVESFVSVLGSMGHASPFEHVTFTFGIEGVSRAFLAQITRHRIASYSVQSQRYVNKENFEFIIPPAIESCERAKSEFLAAMEEDRAHYIKLAELLKAEHKQRLTGEGMNEKDAENAAKRLAYEDARSVLPNACDTKMIVTMNVRSLYNFFSLRCCNRAQWEIRQVATEMLRLCKQTCPVLFKNAGPTCVNGKCGEGAMSCGKAKEIREFYLGL